ncbi:MAG: hypothetical protein WKH97_04135 [Casimicrobiaceae bacterium]
MNQIIPAGRRIPQFVAETGVGRTKLLTMPRELQPASVMIGRCRIITESPSAWLERMAASQADDTAR